MITGEHKAAQISFMLVGHTKFASDRFFGLIKKRYRRSSVDTLNDIVCVVKESTTTKQNKAQLIRSLDGVKNGVFFQWTVFLQQFFKSIQNILKYHSFTVGTDRPGAVVLREYSDTEELAVYILKVSTHDIFTAGMAEPTYIKGLDPQ